ncbi:sporulation protein YunB [uncultured Clostridium sp.]|uniref:sporulation protein YunB n=1 Tax=uncultured Clostridium sp. TaxID=59620 RepID=UPI0026399B11|nr:sporulation protein YunB [uncultured Clostridium sp.]
MYLKQKPRRQTISYKNRQCSTVENGYMIEHKIRFYGVISVISLSILFTSFIYYFDKIIAPTVLLVADAEMRAKAMDIINKNIGEIYGGGFVYEEIMEVDKDELGKINFISADTMKLNELATKVAIEAQKDIEEVGSVGVKVPIGYALQNNILAYFGPSITVRMEPIGRVKTSYESSFESAGINQTRHKIYINLETNLKIVLPLQSREVIVKHQIPIAENIILGEVPRTSIGVDAIKDALNDDYEKNGIESESIEDINPLDEAGEITLPDVPELGVEFGE